jgi:hypothetical protein
MDSREWGGVKRPMRWQAFPGSLCVEKGHRAHEGLIMAANAKFAMPENTKPASGLRAGSGKSNAAFPGLKITWAVSTRWKGQNSPNASIPEFCCLLEHLIERLDRRSRGVSIRWVHVRQGRIEGPMA